MHVFVSRLRQNPELSDTLKQSGILYTGGLISVSLTFIQQLTTANLLGITLYGQLAVILSMGLLFALLFDLRTNELGLKLLAQPLQYQQHAEIVRVLTWLNLIELLTGVVGALLLIMLAVPVAVYLLNDAAYGGLVAFFALSVPFRVMSSGITSVLPRLYNHFDWLALKSIAYAGLRLILMTGAAGLGLGLNGVVAGALLSEVLGLLILYGFVIRIHQRERRTYALFDRTRPANFSRIHMLLGTYWLNSTILGIHYHFFLPFIALLTTPAQVGLLRAGMDIAELIEKIVQPLQIVFAPRIIVLYTQQRLQEFRRYVLHSAALLNGVTLALSFAIAVAAPFILPRLYTTDEFAGLTEIVLILLVGYTMFYGQYWTRPVVVTMDLLNPQSVWLILLLIVICVVGFAIVPGSGAFGGALLKTAFFLAYTFISAGLIVHRARYSHKAA